MSHPMHETVARLDAAVTGINQLSQLVGSGQVRLNPEEMGDAVKEIDGYKDEIKAMADDAARLGEPMRLGDNPVATPMAAKFARRAVGDPVSWQSVLRKYWEVLDACQTNINGAVRNYRNTEAHNTATFRRLPD